jgi:S1-C subfamily serine protease
MDELSPPPRPQPPQTLRSSGLPWLLALLSVLAAVLFLPSFVERVYYSMTIGRERAKVDSARSQLPSPTLTEISRQFAVVAKAIEPSVVHIDTVQSVDGVSDVSDARLTPQAIGQGSGVIVDEAGYILTNNHVVENASEIRVNLSGNESRQAEVVGLDETTDLAVLKIPAGGLIAAQWGDSEALEVGSLVWAVGNPFGLDRSVTLGIVSAKNRRRFRGMSPYQDFLQTDAAINPGNSGGPLVDVSGKIVGINTAIVGRSYQGVSFSIPTSTAQEVYERLRESGKVTRGFMGVTLGDLTAEFAEKAGTGSLAGAVVLGVGSDTPAAKAGILAGDIILAWDGQAVRDATELTLLVGKTKVGETVKVKIIRGGEPLEVDLRVEERPVRLTR